MLEKTERTIIRVTGNLPPQIVRRIEAIPVALPLKAPMKMAGITINKAENLIVRVELEGGPVGWGEAPSAPTMCRFEKPPNTPLTDVSWWRRFECCRGHV